MPTNKTPRKKPAAAAVKKPVAEAPKPVGAAALVDPAFLAENDAAVQQEKLLGFWQTYKLWIVTGLSLVLLCVLGWHGWRMYEQHQAASLAEAMFVAQGDVGKLTALLPRATGGNKALIAFAQARAKVGSPVEADRAYGLVYNDRGMPDWLRGVARLQAAMVLLGRDDTLAQEHLSQLVQEGAPAVTEAPALELLAIVAQNKGDVATARQYLQRLLGMRYLTSDLRQRAEQHLAALK